MIDLAAPRAVHVVGVGGTGMSVLASLLVQMGHRVTGSDHRASAVLDRLAAEGVGIMVGQHPDHLDGVDVVVHSSIIPTDNVELVAARERGLPVLVRAELLEVLSNMRRTISVSGTHGKTTTSAMLVAILSEAGLRPSCVVGGDLAQLDGGGARWDDGEWFVCEADESDATFLSIRTEIAVVTNVAADHLEFYGGFAELEAAFDRFLGGSSTPPVVCADDAVARRLGAAHGATTYGTAPESDVRVDQARTTRDGERFVLAREGRVLGEVAVPVPGVHNARNAAAALAVALRVGVPFDVAVRALAAFGGVGRRFERRGAERGVTVVDDYAHNPGKVAAVLGAARAGGWDRIVAVFQPHRYSRTAELWQEFGSSFDAADVLVVTEVYAAGEQPRPGVSGRLIVSSVLDHRPWGRVAWLPRREDVLRYLVRELRPGDLCLTLGAGDVTTLPDDLLAELRGSASGPSGAARMEA